MGLIEIITVLGGIITGGGIYKIYDRYYAAKKYTYDTQSAYRQELKDDVRQLREEMNKIQSELIESNKNYIKLLMEHAKLQIMYDGLKNENTDLRKKIEHLETRLDKK